MKAAYTLICTISFVAVISGFALPRPGANLSPEQRAARHEHMMRVTGGLLTIPGKGKITICDAQKRIPQTSIQHYANAVAKQLQMTIEVVDLPHFKLADAGSEKTKTQANAVMFAVDDPTLPMSIITSEGPWGIVNLAALVADKPTDELLETRYKKMFVRTIYSLLGAGYSSMKGSIMQNVSNLDDLDAIKKINLDPQSMMSIMQRLPRLGITPPKKVPYIKACKEGWAPAPTNDLQKAVWTRVKAEKERGPAKAILIKP